MVFDQRCWLPLRALLMLLLLSSCMQCYCEALRAQTRWGALEVLFIIIIIIMIIMMTLLLLLSLLLRIYKWVKACTSQMGVGLEGDSKEGTSESI